MAVYRLRALLAWSCVIATMFGSAPLLANCLDLDDDVRQRAGWMSGGWGIRVVLPGGNGRGTELFDARSLMRELAEMRTARWIMVNLNAGSLGGRFTAPLPASRYSVDERMAPSRDLLGEALREIHAGGKKALVYIAAQGPYSENVTHWPPPESDVQTRARDMILDIRGDWAERARSLAIGPDVLWAELLADFSKRYGSLIDGWWVDYGRWGDAKALSTAMRAGNPQAVVAWNQNHGSSKTMIPKVRGKALMPKWVLGRSHAYEDLTGGHPSPPEVHEPWWKGNEEMVAQAEESCSISGALAHIFMPMQANWRGGEVWQDGALAWQWMSRTLRAGGAWTWAVALEAPEFSTARLSKKQFSLLRQLDERVAMRLVVGEE